jgi:predicted RecA/RadA family phage recombinase
VVPGTGVAPIGIATLGVFEVPKLANAVITAGARVAWDDTRAARRSMQ